jgi:hypothetical protein
MSWFDFLVGCQVGWVAAMLTLGTLARRLRKRIEAVT